MVERERESGVAREKEERNSFSQNLERESHEDNEEFWPKTTFIPLCVQVPEYPCLRRVKSDTDA